jgi:hypothetical protein
VGEMSRRIARSLRRRGCGDGWNWGVGRVRNVFGVRIMIARALSRLLRRVGARSLGGPSCGQGSRGLGRADGALSGWVMGRRRPRSMGGRNDGGVSRRQRRRKDRV